MFYIPFIGRLNLAEYIALVGSFVLVGTEVLIRILTLALPSQVIILFYRASRRLFNRFTSPATKISETKNQDVSHSLRNASDFVSLCALYGYYAEEHVVQTRDGYLLGLHRLAWKRGEEEQKVNNGSNSIRKNVVYLHHGLLMNSEVWVCLTDEQRCLPFTLVEKGYDVWLGNNRGNKYSKKSIHHSPQDIPFWNFSMDDFAFHDIPDSIEYVLDTTAAPSLSYIGFSQGTAQAFATLAVHPKLNDKVNVFIALAPAMSPAGLSNGVVDALVKASPQVLFLLFGRRSILSSATMWQSILYPPIFVWVIDSGLDFLFGWKAKNISMAQKLGAYPHLYSFTSTKSVVHWFQIMRNASFQMYDDEPAPVVSTGNKYTKVAKFPTKNIKTPVVLVYGGSDSLVDINVMLKELPSHTIATEIPHYEHLDFLWARDVDTLVFPHVFDALENFIDAEHTQEEFASYRKARHASLIATQRPQLSYLSEDDSATTASFPDIDAIPASKARNVQNGTNYSTPSPQRQRVGTYSSTESSPTLQASPTVSSSEFANAGPFDGTNERNGSGTSPPTDKKMKRFSNNSIFSTPVRSPSIISFDGRGKGKKGISIGAGRAVSGVVSGVETQGSLVTSIGDDSANLGRKREKK